MRAGKLRHRITIQKKGPVTRSASNQEVFSWVDVLTVRAEARPASGRELLRSGAQLADATTVFSIRYRKGLTPAMRVLWGDHVLDLKQVIDVDGRGRELELLCTEVVR